MTEKDQKDKIKVPSVEEYRLVPVEQETYFEEDEKVIDLVGLAQDLWSQRSVIFGFILAFLIIGVVMFTFSERIYYSETILMPESRGTSQAGRLMQQFQPFLGTQQALSERDELSVSLYPKIVESLPFQIELIQSTVFFENPGVEVTLYEYFTEIRERTLFQKAGTFLWNITFGLPGTLRNLFTAPGEGNPSAGIDFDSFLDLETPKVVDYRVRQVTKTMADWITVRIEPQTGFIVIGVAMPDANASAETVSIVREKLTSHVTTYRTDKAIMDMEFYESQYERAREQYLRAQDSLVTFLDQNQNLVTARASATGERLTADFNRHAGIYNNIATRLEEARIKVQEDTPVFRIHEPVTIPSRPSIPNASRMFLGALFLGLFSGIAWIYSRRALSSFFFEFNNKDRKSQATDI